jgi:hypothetical protein
MQKLMLAALFCVSTQAFGDEPKTPATTPAAMQAATPASPFDLAKAGPWTRKPTDEKKLKKELEAFFKEEDALATRGDREAMLARIDFPVFMVTDDQKGTAETRSYTREQYLATMKPFYDNMPKDVKYTHKPTFTVLSDSLADVTDEFTMTTGKQKLAGRNQSLVIKVDGQWKWKVMTEAGWGGVGEQANR